LAVVARPARRTLQVGSGWLTFEHPVFTGGDFAPVGELGPKAQLHTPLGVTTMSIRGGDIREVFDVVVSPPHTFYAGGILVHNKSVAWSPSLGNMWRFAPIAWGKATGGYGK